MAATIAPALHGLSFEDVSDAVGFLPGLSNTNNSTPACGIAVADFNRNGWPDIFVTGHMLDNRMYFNLGGDKFVEAPSTHEQIQGDRCSVAAAADFDNDGWPDLYIACHGDGNRLLRNLQESGFADVTPAALGQHPGNPATSRTDAVAWGDLAGNGLPDLYLGVYPDSNQPDLANENNLDRILINLGQGQWLNVAEGLTASKLARTALAATFTDIDGDGRADLYVVNDKLHGNVLWRNEGPGCGGWCLIDVAPASGADRPVFGMGIAVGDIDRDGRSDLYISSIGEQVVLRTISHDPLRFEQVQDPVGLNHPGVGWATIFADFDNDGFEDAYLAVSTVSGAPEERDDLLARNTGDGHFEDVSAGSGLDTNLPSQCAALIDFDGDGRLDLVIGHPNLGYRLYRNTSESGNFIAFRLKGGAGITRDAVGARVTISTPDGSQWREMRLGESRGASHQPRLHFGLGAATEAEVTAHWPGGLVQDFGFLPAGQVHELIHDPGILFADSFEPPSSSP